jgi:hypothetical protein
VAHTELPFLRKCRQFSHLIPNCCPSLIPFVNGATAASMSQYYHQQGTKPNTKKEVRNVRICHLWQCCQHRTRVMLHLRYNLADTVTTIFRNSSIKVLHKTHLCLSHLRQSQAVPPSFRTRHVLQILHPQSQQSTPLFIRIPNSVRQKVQARPPRFASLGRQSPPARLRLPSSRPSNSASSSL